MQQITSGNLNINVTDAPNIGVPNTGVGAVINNLGEGGCAIIITALIFIALVVLFRFLRRKLRGGSVFAAVILVLTILASTFSVSSVVVAIKAIQDAANDIDLDIVLIPGETVTATAKTSIRVGDINGAHMIYVYVEQDNNLRNTENPNMVIAPTEATNSSDPEGLSLNSYGIKMSTDDNFVPLSNDANKPTMIYVSEESGKSGVIELTYGVKLDSSMAAGTYTNAHMASNTIKYVVEPQHNFTLNYESVGNYNNMPNTEVYGPVAVFEHDFVISDENIPTREGYAFGGWCDGVLDNQNSCDGVTYQPGENITVEVDAAHAADATTTLYAIWAPKTYTITYKSYDGGTAYGTQDFVYDTTINMLAHNAANGWAVAPEAPTDKTFAGWTTTQGSTTPTYTDEQSVNNLTSDITVYAIWKQDLALNFYQGDGTNDKVEKTIYNASTSTLYNPPVVDNRDSAYSAAGWGATNTATTAEIAQTAVFKTLTQSDNNKSYYAIYEYDISTSYKPNGGSGLMIGGFCVAHSVAKGGNESGYNTVGCDITLPNSGYTNAGYEFTKWAEGSTTGTQYSAGDTRSLTTNTDYYAIWELPPTTFSQAYAAAGKSKLGSYYKMQDMTSAICSAVTTATTTGKEQTEVLIDSRDNKLYYVSKLRDGKCWMTQNLDLDITASGFAKTDTDLNSQTTWNWNASRDIAIPATASTFSSSAIYDDARSWDLGNYVYDGATNMICSNISSYSDCSKGFSTTSATTTAANHYHVGNLYQYYAATAGTGGYYVATTDGTQVQDSICPKGWRLPTGGNSGEFAGLVTTYLVGTTVQTMINNPFYMVRNGQLNNSTLLKLADRNSYYWTSTVYSNQNAYAFYLSNDSTINPAFNDRKYVGRAIRCIAR